MKTSTRSRNRVKKRVAALFLVLAAPLTLVGVVGHGAGGLFWLAADLTSIDISETIIHEANSTRLAEMAAELEFYLERDHLPLNYTLSALWNSDFSEIQSYTVGGDAAIWTGMTLAMVSLRYAVIAREGNETRTAQALDLVKRLVSGVSLLMGVPNGGIGPEYPGILARSVVPKDWVAENNPPVSGFNHDIPASDDPDVFDGLGDYEGWLWRGYPSLDQYSGIIMGITVAAGLVDDPSVQVTLKALSAQIIEHHRRSNFYLVDDNVNSRTTGQSFQWKPEHTGAWVLSVLFMGTLTDPAAYRPLYYHYAIEQGYADPAMLASDLSLFKLFNYFSLNINWVIFYPMAFLETDPALRSVYEWLASSFYDQVKTDRNAWLNMAYLQMVNKNDTGIQADVNDQLMRFDNERIPGQPNSTRIPERGLATSGNTYPLTLAIPRRVPNIGLGNLFIDDEYLTRPKTVEEYQSVDFCWQRSPWRINDYSPARRQDSGLSFLLPYYMARFHGSIQGGEAP